MSEEYKPRSSEEYKPRSSEEYKPRSSEELKRLSEMLSDSSMLVTKEWFHSQVDKIKQEKE